MRHALLSTATALLCVALLAGGLATRLEAQSGDTTVRLASDAIVDVTLRTGRLIVRGTDGSTGTVRAADRNYQLRSTGVSLVVAPRDDAAVRRSRGDRNDDALELEVPRGVRLVVSTHSADVELHDLTGTVEVRSTSGTLQAERVRGRFIAETISGDVRTSGTAAGVRITTVSGDVRVREVRGEVELHTTSGDVSVSGTAISRFDVESMSGDVQFDGLLTSDARVQVHTHSGDVTLRVPDDARGRLEFSTVTGDLTASGPLTLLPGDVSGNRRSRNVRRYEFGAGGASGLQIDLSTFSGDVRLVRTPRS